MAPAGPPSIALTGLDGRPGERDAMALDQIAEMLRDPEWAPGMLEDIAGLITSTGRSVESYPGDRPTWARH